MTLSFLGLSGRRKELFRAVDVKPGGVVWVESCEVPGLPIHRRFAVLAEGNVPFCAQVFVRAFTRGLPYTRSMYSLMGLPMRLQVKR